MEGARISLRILISLEKTLLAVLSNDPKEAAEISREEVPVVILA